MRMLKSGLKLVVDTEWIFDEDSGDLTNLVVQKNTYDGIVYWEYPVEQNPILSGFDVKLPLNHRYVITYWNLSNEFAATIYFDTFGIEEQYQADIHTDATGYQAAQVWYYNIDSEEVGSYALSFAICDKGIRLSPVYMGNYSLRIYQLD